MRVVVLGSFLDGDGDPSMTMCVQGSIRATLLTIPNSFDYNNRTGGTSFLARHKNWKRYTMMEDFSKWGAECFGESLF
jgi:hypothetical protein